MNPCQPRDRNNGLGLYPPSKTDYASSGNLEAFRAFNILVETDDDKRPAEDRLGTDDNLLKCEGRGDGHVPRNLRLAVQLIDVVEPYVEVISSTFTLLPASVPPGTCNDPRALRGSRAGHVRALPSIDVDASGAAEQFRAQYTSWLTGDSCGGNNVRVEARWDVGGGYTVDNTQLLVGYWPANVAPNDLFLPPSANDDPGTIRFLVLWVSGGCTCVHPVVDCRVFAVCAVLAQWKAFYSGRVSNTSALPIAYQSSDQSGVTRWRDASIPDLAVQPYTHRFQACGAVDGQWDGASADAAGNATEAVHSFVVFVYARVDQDWTEQTSPDPNLPPQSHVVNARTNIAWEKRNNGHVVRGRLLFFAPVRACVCVWNGDGWWVSCLPWMCCCFT